MERILSSSSRWATRVCPLLHRLSSLPGRLWTTRTKACFLGALQMMAGRLGKNDAVKDAVIHTSVQLGEADQIGGFGIAVDIKVEGVEDEEVIKAGHEVCCAPL